MAERNKVTVYDCSVIELGRHQSRAGNISIIENNINLPFDMTAAIKGQLH